MRIEDARVHLAEAMRLLTLEAYRGADPDDMQVAEHFTIANELDRIDCAIGSRGASVFAGMADSVRSEYVEMMAAKDALK